MNRFGLCIVLAVLLFGQSDSRAEGIVAALSRETVLIDSGFTGTELFLYGTIESEPGDQEPGERRGRRSDAVARAERGDVIVVLRGPEERVTVREKQRRGLIWMNSERVTYSDVPSFYLVATTAPLEKILPPESLKLYGFGLDNLRLNAVRGAGRADLDDFRKGMIRVKERQRLYSEAIGAIQFRGPLFSTEITIPPNAPVGYYSVQAFLVHDGNVRGLTWSLLIDKAGFERWAFRLADEEPIVYGLLSVLLALAAGAAAAAVVRN